jgi:hypothetical protein
MNDDNFETDLRLVLSEGSEGAVPERLRASVAHVPERVASGRPGSRGGFRGIAAALTAVASAIVVVAVIFGAIFLRSNGTGTPAGNGAPPTPRVACSELSAAACEGVRAEVVQFIGPDRQALSIDISTNSICLGDPFHPIPCPLDPQYFGSGVAQLRDGEWAFVNVFSAADGQFRSDGRILTPPAGWTDSPPSSPDPIGIGVVNSTDLQVSLVVNGTVIETLAPHTVDEFIHMTALPPLPWVVQARTSSGRVLATMTVGSVDVQTQPGNGWSYGNEAGADLSCGQLYLWTGASEPIWPAPGSGFPGDCLP